MDEHIRLCAIAGTKRNEYLDAFFLRITYQFQLGFSRVRLKTFSCHECVHLGDGSTKIFEIRTWLLLVIAYSHASISVGSRACFLRFLKIELTSLEKYLI